MLPHLILVHRFCENFRLPKLGHAVSYILHHFRPWSYLNENQRTS